MQKCEGCKFWSEMIAKCEGGGPVLAMCLNNDSPKYETYSYWACEKKEEGQPIDAPA